MEKHMIYKYVFVRCIYWCIICCKGAEEQHFYVGSEEAKISCRDKTGIEITNIEIMNSPTQCDREMCTLTHDDKKKIENICNGYSSCIFPVHSIRPCFTDKGFYNVEYSCKTVAMKCHFENDWCGWTFKKSVWRFEKEKQNKYVYGQTDENSITIESGPIFRNKNQCITLNYYLYYPSVKMTLYRQLQNGTKIKEREVSQFNNNNIFKTLILSVEDTDDYKLVIEVTGYANWTEVAFDNVIVYNLDCNDLTSSAYVQYYQLCKRVDEKTSLDGCYSNYLNVFAVYFDTSNADCNYNQEEKANFLCNGSDITTFCDPNSIVAQNPPCSYLNRMMIGYTCTETTRNPTTTHMFTLSDKAGTSTEYTATATHRPIISDETGSTQGQTDTPMSDDSDKTSTTLGRAVTLASTDSDKTGMVVGVIIGCMLIVGLIITVILVVIRWRNNHEKSQNKNSNRLDIYNVPPGQAQNHGLSKTLATNNPSYELDYISSVNKPDTEYMNMPRQTGLQSNHVFNSEYNVLDPTETGFNGTNGNIYELASPINQNSDEYADLVAGVYDISGKSRHQVKDTIYDHSVDATYDTTNRGRQEDLEDYTYNHVFGKQTEDDYDIAGS